MDQNNELKGELLADWILIYLFPKQPNHAIIPEDFAQRPPHGYQIDLMELQKVLLELKQKDYLFEPSYNFYRLTNKGRREAKETIGILRGDNPTAYNIFVANVPSLEDKHKIKDIQGFIFFGLLAIVILYHLSYVSKSGNVSWWNLVESYALVVSLLASIYCLVYIFLSVIEDIVDSAIRFKEIFAENRKQIPSKVLRVGSDAILWLMNVPLLIKEGLLKYRTHVAVVIALSLVYVFSDQLIARVLASWGLSDTVQIAEVKLTYLMSILASFTVIGIMWIWKAHIQPFISNKPKD